MTRTEGEELAAKAVELIVEMFITDDTVEPQDVANELIADGMGGVAAAYLALKAKDSTDGR